MQKIENCKSKTKNAYTLVELALVLFIISFITVFSFTGIAIKKRAIINTVMADLDMLAKSYKQFVSIYKAVPGDLESTRGAKILGSTSGYGNNYTIQFGNGDGLVNNVLVDSSSEPYGALQHLAVAGLIKGEYYGSATVSASVPSYMPGPVMQSGYIFGSTSSTFGSYSPFSKTQVPPYTPLISFSGFQLTENTINSGTVGPVFTPNDMEMIDVKFDDGVPNTGKIYAQNSSQPVAGGTSTTGTCIVTTTTPYSYSTNLTGTAAVGCYMAYILDQHQ